MKSVLKQIKVRITMYVFLSDESKLTSFSVMSASIINNGN